jgi:hypothetical protein
MGTMIMIYKLDDVKLNTIQVNASQSDYVFNNKSLTKISSNDLSSYYRLCLKVLTTRYYYNSSNQTFNVTFNSSGTFNLDVYMYDSNKKFALNKTITGITVTGGNIINFRNKCSSSNSDCLS